MAAFQCPLPGVNQPVTRERPVTATRCSSLFFLFLACGDNELGKRLLTSSCGTADIGSPRNFVILKSMYLWRYYLTDLFRKIIQKIWTP